MGGRFLHRPTTIVFWSFVILCWLAFSLFGLARLADYSARPNDIQPPPERWPRDSKIPLSADACELVMFVHPKCPCTRASLAELARLIPRLSRPVNITVAFVVPEGLSAEFAHGTLWNWTEEIPVARRFVDKNGMEARRFNATISGHVVLYGISGELRFYGGITSGRGHEGGNVGVETLLRRIESVEDHHRRCEVYGCPLLDPVDPGREQGQ